MVTFTAMQVCRLACENGEQKGSLCLSAEKMKLSFFCSKSPNPAFRIKKKS